MSAPPVNDQDTQTVSANSTKIFSDRFHYQYSDDKDAAGKTNLIEGGSGSGFNVFSETTDVPDWKAIQDKIQAEIYSDLQGSAFTDPKSDSNQIAKAIVASIQDVTKGAGQDQYKDTTRALTDSDKWQMGWGFFNDIPATAKSCRTYVAYAVNCQYRYANKEEAEADGYTKYAAPHAKKQHKQHHPHNGGAAKE